LYWQVQLFINTKFVSLLAPLSVLNTRKKSSVTKLNKNSKIFKTIIKAIEDKKGEKIISLDLRKIPEAVADFFIVCEASNTTQIKAISDYIEYLVQEVCDDVPYKHEGKQALQWVLIDYVNIVVHIMHPEARKFYRLEEMWSDADTQGHDQE
jgi:ribosome-associated protein